MALDPSRSQCLTLGKATESIAQFELLEGMPIGAEVTLRGDRMRSL